MINRLTDEFKRFIRRSDEITTWPEPCPIIHEKIGALSGQINVLADRIKIFRDEQKKLLTILQIIRGIDFHIDKGDEQVPPEILGIRKLAAFTGQSRVRRVRDNEIIPLSRLDSRYEGHPGKRNTLYFFSSSPRPAVYALQLSGIGISTDPVYVPLTTTEAVK